MKNIRTAMHESLRAVQFERKDGIVEFPLISSVRLNDFFSGLCYG